MKFKVTMKDPDTLDDAITDAVEEEVDRMGLEPDEAQAIREVREDKARSAASKWFAYGECLTVEVDTDAGTCTVVPR